MLLKKKFKIVPKGLIIFVTTGLLILSSAIVDLRAEKDSSFYKDLSSFCSLLDLSISNFKDNCNCENTDGFLKSIIKMAQHEFSSERASTINALYRVKLTNWLQDNKVIENKTETTFKTYMEIIELLTRPFSDLIETQYDSYSKFLSLRKYLSLRVKELRTYLKTLEPSKGKKTAVEQPIGGDTIAYENLSKYLGSLKAIKVLWTQLINWEGGKPGYNASETIEEKINDAKYDRNRSYEALKKSTFYSQIADKLEEAERACLEFQGFPYSYYRIYGGKGDPRKQLQELTVKLNLAILELEKFLPKGFVPRKKIQKTVGPDEAYKDSIRQQVHDYMDKRWDYYEKKITDSLGFEYYAIHEEIYDTLVMKEAAKKFARFKITPEQCIDIYQLIESRKLRDPEQAKEIMRIWRSQYPKGWKPWGE